MATRNREIVAEDSDSSLDEELCSYLEQVHERREIKQPNKTVTNHEKKDGTGKNVQGNVRADSKASSNVENTCKDKENIKCLENTEKHLSTETESHAICNKDTELSGRQIQTLETVKDSEKNDAVLYGKSISEGTLKQNYDEMVAEESQPECNSHVENIEHQENPDSSSAADKYYLINEKDWLTLCSKLSNKDATGVDNSVRQRTGSSPSKEPKSVPKANTSMFNAFKQYSPVKKCNIFQLSHDGGHQENEYTKEQNTTRGKDSILSCENEGHKKSESFPNNSGNKANTSPSKVEIVYIRLEDGQPKYAGNNTSSTLPDKSAGDSVQNLDFSERSDHASENKTPRQIQMNNENGSTLNRQASVQEKYTRRKLDTAETFRNLSSDEQEPFVPSTLMGNTSNTNSKSISKSGMQVRFVRIDNKLTQVYEDVEEEAVDVYSAGGHGFAIKETEVFDNDQLAVEPGNVQNDSFNFNDSQLVAFPVNAVDPENIINDDSIAMLTPSKLEMLSPSKLEFVSPSSLEILTPSKLDILGDQSVEITSQSFSSPGHFLSEPLYTSQHSDRNNVSETSIVLKVTKSGKLVECKGNDSLEKKSSVPDSPMSDIERRSRNRNSHIRKLWKNIKPQTCRKTTAKQTADADDSESEKIQTGSSDKEDFDDGDILTNYFLTKKIAISRPSHEKLSCCSDAEKPSCTISVQASFSDDDDSLQADAKNTKKIKSGKKQKVARTKRVEGTNVRGSNIKIVEEVKSDRVPHKRSRGRQPKKKLKKAKPSVKKNSSTTLENVLSSEEDIPKKKSGYASIKTHLMVAGFKQVDFKDFEDLTDKEKPSPASKKFSENINTEKNKGKRGIRKKMEEKSKRLVTDEDRESKKTLNSHISTKTFKMPVENKMTKKSKAKKKSEGSKTEKISIDTNDKEKCNSTELNFTGNDNENGNSDTDGLEKIEFLEKLFQIKLKEAAVNTSGLCKSKPQTSFIKNSPKDCEQCDDRPQISYNKNRSTNRKTKQSMGVSFKWLEKSNHKKDEISGCKRKRRNVVPISDECSKGKKSRKYENITSEETNTTSQVKDSVFEKGSAENVGRERSVKRGRGRPRKHVSKGAHIKQVKDLNKELDIEGTAASVGEQTVTDKRSGTNLKQSKDISQSVKSKLGKNKIKKNVYIHKISEGETDTSIEVHTGTGNSGRLHQACKIRNVAKSVKESSEKARKSKVPNASKNNEYCVEFSKPAKQQKLENAGEKSNSKTSVISENADLLNVEQKFDSESIYTESDVDSYLAKFQPLKQKLKKVIKGETSKRMDKDSDSSRKTIKGKKTKADTKNHVTRKKEEKQIVEKSDVTKSEILGKHINQESEKTSAINSEEMPLDLSLPKIKEQIQVNNEDTTERTENSSPRKLRGGKQFKKSKEKNSSKNLKSTRHIPSRRKLKCKRFEKESWKDMLQDVAFKFDFDHKKDVIHKPVNVRRMIRNILKSAKGMDVKEEKKLKHREKKEKIIKRKKETSSSKRKQRLTSESDDAWLSDSGPSDSFPAFKFSAMQCSVDKKESENEDDKVNKSGTGDNSVSPFLKLKAPGEKGMFDLCNSPQKVSDQQEIKGENKISTVTANKIASDGTDNSIKRVQFAQESPTLKRNIDKLRALLDKVSEKKVAKHLKFADNVGSSDSEV